MHVSGDMLTPIPYRLSKIWVEVCADKTRLLMEPTSKQTLEKVLVGETFGMIAS